MVVRNLKAKIVESKKSILLLGPRQVGKSTLLHETSPDLIIDLASETDYFKHASDPLLLESILAKDLPRRILIDEIQRLPQLLNTVQYWVDQSARAKRKVQFLLSGSSVRKLKRGYANLAPGRVQTYSMSGFSAAELKYQINLKQGLRFGFLPEAYLEKEEAASEKLLRDYSATYLREEIQAEALTRNISGFSRFLKAVAENAGSIVDISKLSTKSKVSRTTATRFVEMLEDTLIAQRVESFQSIPEADVVKHPKIFFFDNGVLNGLLENFHASADRIGRLFEHLVFNQIRNSALSLDRPCEIYFFRTRHGLEVDFVVKIDQTFWAIEVKAGAVAPGDLQGLHAFRDYYGKNCKLAVVSLKESRARLKGGCLILGVNELMQEMGL